MGRDTAAAIGYAAVCLLARDPEAVFVTVPADAHVDDAQAYAESIRLAFDAAESGSGIALVGIPPRYPETGYGCIEIADERIRLGEPTSVVRFVEKPDLATATEYLRSGRYLWNPALFVFRASNILERFVRYLPTHAVALNACGVLRAIPVRSRRRSSECRGCPSMWGSRSDSLTSS